MQFSLLGICLLLCSVSVNCIFVRGEYVVSEVDVGSEAIDDIFNRVEDAACGVLSATHRCREKYVFLNTNVASSTSAEASCSPSAAPSSTLSNSANNDIQIVQDKYIIGTARCLYIFQ